MKRRKNCEAVWAVYQQKIISTVYLDVKKIHNSCSLPFLHKWCTYFHVFVYL